MEKPSRNKPPLPTSEAEFLAYPTASLQFPKSSRAYRAAAEYRTVFDVIHATDADLRRIPEMGTIALAQLREAVEAIRPKSKEEEDRCAIDIVEAVITMQAENRRLKQRVEGLEADLDAAIITAWNRGAHAWVKDNYPTHYATFTEKPATE